MKWEEATFRDFGILGNGANLNSPYGKIRKITIGNDAGVQDNLVLAALQTDLNGPLGNLIQWGNKVTLPTSTPPTPSSGMMNIL